VLRGPLKLAILATTFSFRASISDDISSPAVPLVLLLRPPAAARLTLLLAVSSDSSTARTSKHTSSGTLSFVLKVMHSREWIARTCSSTYSSSIANAEVSVYVAFQSTHRVTSNTTGSVLALPYSALACVHSFWTRSKALAQLV
jgi:hypothetical protein